MNQSSLCNRCELLFQECRPLLRAVCPLTRSPADRWHEYEFEPDTTVLARWAEAIVVNWKARTNLVIRAPITVFDFYEGRP